MAVETEKDPLASECQRVLEVGYSAWVVDHRSNEMQPFFVGLDPDEVRLSAVALLLRAQLVAKLKGRSQPRTLGPLAITSLGIKFYQTRFSEDLNQRLNNPLHRSEFRR